MGKFIDSLKSGLGGALSGVAGGLLGSVGSKAIDSLFGSDPNKQNMKIMQMQNLFNALEAQKNRDFQLQMYNMTNAYNSPKQQVQRMMEAGLNPDLMYGGNGQSIAAQSPSGSQASGSSPIAAVDMQQRAANVALTQAQTRLIEHQSDNLDSDTENKNADTQLKKTEQEFQRDFLQGQIDYQALTIKLGNYELNTIKPAEWKVLTQTANKLSEECLNLQEQRNLIKKEIASIGVDMYLKRVEMFLRSQEVQAKIKVLAEQAHLMKAQAARLVLDTLLLGEARDAGHNNYIATSKLATQQASYFKVSSDRIHVDYDIDINGHNTPFTYRLAERDLAGARDATATLSEIASDFMWGYLMFKGFKREPRPRIGFR